jgi:hemoglobin-like flavoprotein
LKLRGSFGYEKEMGSGLTKYLTKADTTAGAGVDGYCYIDGITLNNSQINELIKTWRMVSLFGSDKIGQKIFKKIFIIAPETFQMFGFSDDPNWEMSRSFLHHAKIVVNIIGSVVNGLKNPQLMEKHLHELGLKHSLFRITSQHFDLLGEYLIVAFQEVLGPAFSSYAAECWNILYRIISRNIQDSMKFHAEVYHLTPMD